jgi:hypothetical protein
LRENSHPKLISHAANPLAVQMKEDIYRVFFSGRDSRNRSSVGAVDINIVERKIIQEHFDPFFVNGQEGSFYADGVSIGNCYEVDGVRYILFMGWQKPTNGHWRGDIGRLILTKDFELRIESQVPFLGIDAVDPISLSYPWVQAKKTGGFEMWYGSTHTWDAGNLEMLHVIHHADSEDGHSWKRNGLAVPYELGKVQAFSRPTVAVNDDGSAEMWFSYRGNPSQKYRIGYAESKNRIDWVVDLSNAAIFVSNFGWDSEMIEYPFVFEHKNCRYMLYNGNSYGKTGFGLAVSTSEMCQ